MIAISLNITSSQNSVQNRKGEDLSYGSNGRVGLLQSPQFKPQSYQNRKSKSIDTPLTYYHIKVTNLPQKPLRKLISCVITRTKSEAHATAIREAGKTSIFYF
jgi:hypothetical protein